MQKKKKKVDYGALNSAFMRIPGMMIEAARGLLDLGFIEVYELIGRSPEALFEKLKEKNPKVHANCLPAFRMAVYYAETEEPDPKQLHLSKWQ